MLNIVWDANIYKTNIYCILITYDKCISTFALLWFPVTTSLQDLVHQEYHELEIQEQASSQKSKDLLPLKHNSSCSHSFFKSISNCSETTPKKTTLINDMVFQSFITNLTSTLTRPIHHNSTTLQSVNALQILHAFEQTFRHEFFTGTQGHTRIIVFLVGFLSTLWVANPWFIRVPLPLHRQQHDKSIRVG